MAVQKIRIKLAAYDHELVDEAASRIVETMKKSGAKISGPIPLPTEREIVTILRSPRKYKDSREQFEMSAFLQNGNFTTTGKICTLKGKKHGTNTSEVCKIECKTDRKSTRLNSSHVF